MGDVKWIKITTNIFDDEKIKLIDVMPARDEILVIWFKMLILAGKANEGGALLMGGKIPYSPEMMAAIFNREIATVKLALATFENFEMIEIESDRTVVVSNWEKHQNVDGLEKIKEQNRLRQLNHRKKRKMLAESNVIDSVTSNVTVTLRHGDVTQQNKNKKENKNKEKNKSNAEDIATIISFLNNQLGTKYKATARGNVKVIEARLDEGFTVENFKTVVIKMRQAWKDTSMEQYLRPETLFGNKFDGYLNQKVDGISETVIVDGIRQDKVPAKVSELTQEHFDLIVECNGVHARFARLWGLNKDDLSYPIKNYLTEYRYATQMGEKWEWTQKK